MKKIKLIFLVLICTSLINCAKRGIPEGGPKDEDPPILVNAEPVENSINFDQKRIRLYFNEYIKLKDFRKQLVVSPPLDKSFYSISPQSGASKYIQIDIKEKLDKDNTYVFNFGQSVVDNNEENKLWPWFGDLIEVDTGNGESRFVRRPTKFMHHMLKKDKKSRLKSSCCKIVEEKRNSVYK